MKIALTLQWNSDFQAIAEITLPVIQKYSAKHGYTTYLHKCDQVSPEIVWQRIEDMWLMIDRYEAVVHIDADCLITNPEVTIESLVEGNDSDLFMSTDKYGINDGFCIWRSTWRGHSKLRELLEVNRYNYTSPQDALSKPKANGIVIHKMPQRLTNSYMTQEYGELDPEAQWQPGDFILHLPALGNDRRVEILEGLC